MHVQALNLLVLGRVVCHYQLSAAAALLILRSLSVPNYSFLCFLEVKGSVTVMALILNSLKLIGTCC